MKILVTGAAGFLGARLIGMLLSEKTGRREISRVIAADIVPCPIDDPRVDRRTGTIADAGFTSSLVETDVDVVYHLAAVLSGQAEAEFDLGMQINVDATRGLLEACRRRAHAPRFVYASTVAVFGGPVPEVVPEEWVVLPESSYGAGKLIAETLVTEYSRRGFVDGLSCRVPTVAVRPGKPNSAVSSFVSGIVREPLAGVDSICPIPLETRLWISSPDVAIRNLVHAGHVQTADLDGRRAINLPGLTVTPAEMLASLERLAGAAARARVRCQLDERIMTIVRTWPGALDVSRPLRLGFTADRDIDSIVAQFIAGSPAAREV
jgi:D-erythronate 2-dehydrogenase